MTSRHKGFGLFGLLITLAIISFLFWSGWRALSSAGLGLPGAGQTPLGEYLPAIDAARGARDLIEQHSAPGR